LFLTYEVKFGNTFHSELNKTTVNVNLDVMECLIKIDPLYMLQVSTHGDLDSHIIVWKYPNLTQLATLSGNLIECALHGSVPLW
jgi:hypothetical protein